MKEKINFKKMSDFELESHKQKLELEIEAVVFEMKYNEKIAKLEEELTEVEKELSSRIND